MSLYNNFSIRLLFYFSLAFTLGIIFCIILTFFDPYYLCDSITIDELLTDLTEQSSKYTKAANAYYYYNGELEKIVDSSLKDSDVVGTLLNKKHEKFLEMNNIHSNINNLV